MNIELFTLISRLSLWFYLNIGEEDLMMEPLLLILTKHDNLLFFFTLCSHMGHYKGHFIESM